MSKMDFQLLPPAKMNEKAYVPRTVGIAKDLAIQEVHVCREGKIDDVMAIFPHDEESLAIRRREIEKAFQNDSPMYQCALCSRPVYLALACSKNREGLHFRHYKEDGDCPAQTRSGLTREAIEALKYNGLKEGFLHRETKVLLEASLRADPDFSEIHVEKHFASRDKTAWRQPDVRAMFRGQQVVFEIQLATTFLSVIEPRTRFYRDQGARLVWVFRYFELENRPAAIDDIFYGNNRNGLLISEKTRDASIKSKKTMFYCHWVKPELRGDEIAEVWNESLVSFADLTNKNGKEFFYDCDAERDKLKLVLFKQQIREFCINYRKQQWEEHQRDWGKLMERANELNFPLQKDQQGEFTKLMSFLFSLEEGRPVGFGYPSLIGVAHHIHDKHATLLRYFFHAENAFKRRDELARSEKWVERRKEAIDDMREKRLSVDRTHDKLVFALFLEIKKLVIESTGLRRRE